MNDSRDPKDLLDWLGLKNAPTWRVSRPLGYLFGFAVVGLFLLAVAAAAWTVITVFTTPAGASLGTGALLVALLGAPFLVWRTIIAQKTVDFQKEGHITDRIAKAVEQLGAEKTVDRIGRPVTLWSGQPVEEERFFPDPDPIDLPPQSEEIDRDQDRRTVYQNLSASVKPGNLVRYRHWPEVRTEIEWRGKPVEVQSHEKIAAVGEWKAFAESVPNIEVRIGGILSLERIAQDSTAYDNGRDHVPIMEILCAYIRENAPASGAKDHPAGEWKSLPHESSDDQREAHRKAQLDRFGTMAGGGRTYGWAPTLPPPRQDIALALRVIGRRSEAQRQIETRWGKAGDPNARWPFDNPAPALPDQDSPHGRADISAFLADLYTWRARLRGYGGYRLDLRGTNLQCADLSDLVLSGAVLGAARMEGANLRQTRMEGADLVEVRMEGANLPNARMQGALLISAKLEGANLSEARMEVAILMAARMERTILMEARLAGATLAAARLESANLHKARMEGAKLLHAWIDCTQMDSARLEGVDLTVAGLKKVNLKKVFISQDQVNLSFGDGSVVLPDGIKRPPHWPDYDLAYSDFNAEWRKWQADPDAYTPPPPPD